MPPRIVEPTVTRSRRVLPRVAAALAVAAAIWALAAVAAASDDPGAFTDDDGAYYEEPLDALAEEGILDGTECASGRICPNEPIERWTMAVWLGRTLSGGEPPEISTTRFADVDPDAWWAAHVEQFAELGVTRGCATEPLRYCPHKSVTRGQMATFLVRAFDLSDADPAGFTDTTGHLFQAQIDALAAARITAGCATDPLRYCPDRPVTRGQMATFIARATGLISLPSDDTGIDPFPVTVFLPHVIVGVDEDGDRRVLDYDNQVFRRASVSPDGRYILYGAENGLFVTTSDLSSSTKVADVPSPSRDLGSQSRVSGSAWSPDSSHIAYILQNNLFVTNAAGTYTYNTSDNVSLLMDWSPDSSRIAYAAMGKLVVSKSDGADTHEVAESLDTWDAYWSPDSSRIVYATMGEFVVSRPDGTGRFTLADALSWHLPSWAPDSSRIAYIGVNKDTLYVTDADGANTHQISVDDPEHFAWSPDSSHIALVGYEEGKRTLFVADVSTSITDQLVQVNPGVQLSYAWSPDSSRIAYSTVHNSGEWPPIAESITREVTIANANGDHHDMIFTSPGLADSSDVEWHPHGEYVRVVYYFGDAGNVGSMIISPDGENVHAVPLGSAISSDGMHAVSFTSFGSVDLSDSGIIGYLTPSVSLTDLSKGESVVLLDYSDLISDYAAANSDVLWRLNVSICGGSLAWGSYGVQGSGDSCFFGG